MAKPAKFDKLVTYIIAVARVLGVLGMLAFAAYGEAPTPVEWFPEHANNPVIVLSNLNAFTANHTGNIVPERDYFSGAYYNFFLAYIGEGNAISGSALCVQTHIGPDPYKIYIWTTSSGFGTPFPKPTPPWDQIGDRLEIIEVSRFDIGGGFVVIPVKKQYRKYCANWCWDAEDKQLGIVMYLSNIEGCNVAGCGAIKLQPWQRLSDFPATPFDAWDRSQVNP